MCNKFLKIADNLVGRLGTIEEYLPEDLTSDSKDDQKIKAAEKRAP